MNEFNAEAKGKTRMWKRTEQNMEERRKETGTNKLWRRVLSRRRRTGTSFRAQGIYNIIRRACLQVQRLKVWDRELATVVPRRRKREETCICARRVLRLRDPGGK